MRRALSFRKRRSPSLSWTARESPHARTQPLIQPGSLARPRASCVASRKVPEPAPATCLPEPLADLHALLPVATAAQGQTASEARTPSPPIESPIRPSCYGFSSTDLIHDHAARCPLEHRGIEDEILFVIRLSSADTLPGVHPCRRVLFHVARVIQCRRGWNRGHADSRVGRLDPTRRAGSTSLHPAAPSRLPSRTGRARASAPVGWPVGVFDRPLALRSFVACYPRGGARSLCVAAWRPRNSTATSSKSESSATSPIRTSCATCLRRTCGRLKHRLAARSRRRRITRRCRRTSNSSVQLTLVAVWRHTVSAGSDPVSTVAGR